MLELSELSLPLAVPVELLLAPWLPPLNSPLTAECCLIFIIFSSILRYIPLAVRMTRTFWPAASRMGGSPGLVGMTSSRGTRTS